MKAIILAAGEGNRLKPITNTIPKPMIKIVGKPILEYNLECIYEYVDEIIIIVRYLKDNIISYFKNDYKGVKITYIEQIDEKGTAVGLKQLDINDNVIVLYGDSILDKKDIERIIKSNYYGGLVKEVSEPEKYGIYRQNLDGFAIEIIEKPESFVGNLANLGGFKFSKEIFEIVKNIPLSKRGEYELTDGINEFLKNNKFELIKISGDFIDVGYPWDILTANNYFLNKFDRTSILGEVEEGVYIKGKITLEEGSILKSGTYIEGNVYIGKNTSIGPNTYLRGGTVIGDNCHIGNAVEIKNSYIGNKTNISHLSYIGDSIIGNNVNIGGGMITANLRHDKKNIKVIINDKLENTSIYKLGVIIGDNVKTGMNTSTYPGRIIKNDTVTMPGEIIR